MTEPLELLRQNWALPKIDSLNQFLEEQFKTAPICDFCMWANDPFRNVNRLYRLIFWHFKTTFWDWGWLMMSYSILSKIKKYSKVTRPSQLHYQLPSFPKGNPRFLIMSRVYENGSKKFVQKKLVPLFQERNNAKTAIRNICFHYNLWLTKKSQGRILGKKSLLDQY